MTAAVASSTSSSGREDSGSLYIPSLDGIRAVSFLIVFFAHAALLEVIPGGFGVTVFFFLSGYLITTLLRLEYEKHGRISLRHFYLRRAFRILPPFYLVLLAAVVLSLTGVLPGRLEILPVLSQFGHLANYNAIVGSADGFPAGTYLYWSLAVEEHFYLFFPLAFIALSSTIRAPRTRALLLLGVCALVLAWRCVLVFALDSSLSRTYIATDTRVDSLLFGCVLALYLNPALDEYGSRARLLWLWLGMPVGLSILLVTFLLRDDNFRESVRYSLQGIALLPLFISAILFHAKWPFKLLNLRFVKFFGVLSYTLYLVHFVVLYALHEHLSTGNAPIAIAALVISFLIAWAVHVAIERPFARLRRRFSGINRKPQTEPDASVPAAALARPGVS
jgi:peptidoglycan/LPS O-acetylase OafA/YrhL